MTGKNNEYHNLVRASNHDYYISGWGIYRRCDRGWRFKEGTLSMSNLYVKTLERVYQPLIDIANSDRVSGNEQAQFEIMQAYELLDKATTRLIIRGWYGSK